MSSSLRAQRSATSSVRPDSHRPARSSPTAAPDCTPCRPPGPCFEHHVRELIAALPNVRLVDRCDVVGFIAQDDRITGVRLIPRSDNGAEQDLVADLVVDTTGRSGRTPAWLEALGHTPPFDEHIRIGVGYASCLLRLDPAALNGDKLIAIGPTVASRGDGDDGRGGRLVAAHGPGLPGPPPASGPQRRHVVRRTLSPARRLRSGGRREPIDDRVATYRLESNLRRHYERLRHFPDGLVVLGDAVTSFNPIYGQGMTVAALQAVALRHCVSQADRFTSRRFLRTSARLATAAWDMTTGADLDLPEVEGPRPVKVRIINAYMRRLMAAASHDTVLATAFMRVAGMVDQPPTLLRPRNVVRVLRGQHTARAGVPTDHGRGWCAVIMPSGAGPTGLRQSRVECRRVGLSQRRQRRLPPDSRPLRATPTSKA